MRHAALTINLLSAASSRQGLDLFARKEFDGRVHALGRGHRRHEVVVSEVALQPFVVRSESSEESTYMLDGQPAYVHVADMRKKLIEVVAISDDGGEIDATC
jgi:hypothetical protein